MRVSCGPADGARWRGPPEGRREFRPNGTGVFWRKITERGGDIPPVAHGVRRRRLRCRKRAFTGMMDDIEVDRPQYQRQGDAEQLSASIRDGDIEYDVYFKTTDGPIGAGVEPFLAVALLPAMRLGRRLHVAGPVSPLLLISLPHLQRRFTEPDPRLQMIDVVAEAANPAPPPLGRRTGAFFSGGVDSFFTLLERHHEISDLVFVSGFDIDQASRELHQVTLEMTQRVAQGTGKRLVHVETNLRHFGDRYVDWAEHLHGPALAAVAHLLSPQIQRMLIPGEYLGGTRVMGSRLDLDPLWSTERVQIVRQGGDVTRLQKLGRIGRHPVVRRCLRVCWENRDGRYNCSTCSKCLRSMAGLRAHGLLDEVETFELPLDLRALSRVKLPRQWPHLAEGMRETLSLVEQRGSDPHLARALRYCLEERYYRSPLYRLRTTSGSLSRRLRSGAGLIGRAAARALRACRRNSPLP